MIPIIKLKRDLEEEVFRAGQDVICDECGKAYRYHQLEVYCNDGETELKIYEMNFPLQVFRLCDGKLVKL